MLIAPLGLSYRPPSPGGHWLLKECPDNFENGKFMLTLTQLVTEEEWETRRFHRWYIYASEAGLRSLAIKVKKKLFHLDEDSYLTLTFEDMHALLRRKDLDVSIVTLYAM